MTALGTSPLVPFSRPISFKRSSPKTFLFKAEKCSGTACHTELYLTTNRGASFSRIATYVYDCFFADSGDLSFVDDDGAHARLRQKS